jgi:hypothetical protein
MKSVLLCVSILIAASAVAQIAPAPPPIQAAPTPPPVQISGPSHVITVKSSPAEDALIAQAKQAESTASTINTLLQQARTELDAKNKPLIDEMKTRSKKWQDKIEAENKDLVSKINANNADAINKFQKETAALQSQAVSPQTLTTLENIVRTEQNLPADAIFDSAKRVWIVPEKK